MTQVSAGDSSGLGARVQGVVRVSDDGTHVYFIAQGKLTGSTPNTQGIVAQDGADNLYVSSGGSVRLVAVLPASDGGLWGEDDARKAQSTPDGRFLVFDSSGPLTADDSDSAVDVYRYDAQTGGLSRVSHGADGYAAYGDGPFDASIDAPNYAAGGSVAGVDSLLVTYSGFRRAVSGDGSFVFFSTDERLVPRDVNGAPDVYEWHDGTVAMVSDGENPDVVVPSTGTAGATTFAGSSLSGGDVFFNTTSVLTPEGGDGAYDLFDARVGGGFSQPVSGVACSDACQGPLSVAPFVASAGGSALTAGGGNLPVPKAAVVKPVKKKAKPKKKAKRKPKKKAKAKKAKAKRVKGERVRGRVVGGGRS
jgi:hypothetical protein